MSIKKWPISERPSEKLFAKGAQSLSDSELLAIFIRCGSKNRSAIDIAKDLIIKHRSIAQLLRCSRANLLNQKGITKNKYILLQAALELAKRAELDDLKSRSDLSKLSAVKKIASHHLAKLHREVFACLFLDKKLRLIQFEILFQGTIDQTPVFPREIIRQALHYNTASLILAHNHPSGDPSPSQADMDITQFIQGAIAYFDIKLIDHIIVGQSHEFSFAENGLI